MQAITVAIVDVDQENCVQLEQSLQKEKGRIEVLREVTSGFDSMVERRLTPRTELTRVENIIARIRRLKPRVLLVNIKRLPDVIDDLLTTLRKQCPETLILLLIDNTIGERVIMKALINGACGYLEENADASSLSKAVYAVDKGEAWVPRRMLAKIMDRILFASHIPS